MTKYLLSIYQPDGPPPPAETLAAVGQRLHVLNEELESTGSWVFTGGLHPPSTATVVRPGGALMTDGPYLEGKEHIG
ncbi:MAG: YciI family protein, partial [Terriglobales bacterium]